MIATKLLDTEEIKSISILIGDLADKYRSAENPELLAELNLQAHQLPWSVKRFFDQFRQADGTDTIAILSGFPIEQERIGKTPGHWDQRNKAAPTVREEIFFLLCGALLGDVFGWATQQSGYLIHDVVPVKGMEYEQIGASSKELLTWHTEDAFHPYKADHVGLMCLRNPGKTETTVGTVEINELEPDIIDVLFQSRFTIHADKSHTPEHQGHKDDWNNEDEWKLAEAYKKHQEVDQGPDKIPVLAGLRSRPRLCIDPFFMDEITDDPEANDALKAVTELIDRKLFGISLNPGDILFLDNSRVVHGRRPFTARYDGNDRWLKRINLTRDLPKSRDARGDTSARIIF